VEHCSMDNRNFGPIDTKELDLLLEKELYPDQGEGYHELHIVEHVNNYFKNHENITLDVTIRPADKHCVATYVHYIRKGKDYKEEIEEDTTSLLFSNS